MTDYGFARVSTADQTTDTQVQQLLRAGVDPARIVTEVQSGVKRRPQLEKLLEELQEGDRLHVTKIDRLGRNARELGDIAEALDKRGVVLVVGGTPHDPRDPMARLLFNLLAMFAEFERDRIAERTRERLHAKRESGEPIGRRRVTTPKQDEVIYTMWQKDFSRPEIAGVTGVSMSTVARVIRAMDARAESDADPSIRRRRRDLDAAAAKARAKELSKLTADFIAGGDPS